MKGRRRCARIDVGLANREGRRKLGIDVGAGKREAVEMRGGYWSAYLDTLFREQESP